MADLKAPETNNNVEGRVKKELEETRDKKDIETTLSNNLETINNGEMEIITISDDPVETTEVISEPASTEKTTVTSPATISTIVVSSNPDVNFRSNQIQAIFRSYPGLFTFKPLTSHKNVRCKACNQEFPMDTIAKHIQLPIHWQYYRAEPPSPVAHVTPNIKAVFDLYPGMFSPCPDDDNFLTCNPCRKKTSKINLLRHLKAGHHVRNVARAQKKETDYSCVSMALTEKVISTLSGSSLLFCNICEVKVSDGLANLKNHLQSEAHQSANKKLGVAKILKDFSHAITVKENEKVWCIKCKVNINGGYETVAQHLTTSGHSRSKDRQSPVSDEEFHIDLARFFTQNRISLKRLNTMRPFFIKHIRRPIPDETTLRKVINEDKKVNNLPDSAGSPMEELTSES